MRRSVYGLLAAQAISMIGTRMSMLALPWFVLATTGSAAKTGLVAFAEMAPYVLACAFGGPVLDRVGVRRASIAADITSALAVAAIPLLHQTGLSFSALIALVAFAGGLRGFGDVAKRALFPLTAKATGMDMTRAAALNDGVSRLATLIGAPVGGLLIAAFSAPSVLLIDAATFLAGGLLVALGVPAPSTADGEAKEPYLRAIRAGLRFIRNDRLVAGMILMFCCTNLFDAAYGSVLIPMWAAQIGQPVALGLVSGAFALGAVLGNVVFTALAPRVPRYAVFVAGFIVGGAPRFAAAALTTDTAIVLTVSFAAGLGMAAINPIAGAVFYERIPQAMMARVLGLSTAVGWAGIPIGALLGGLIAQAWTLTPSLLAFGAAYLLVTLVPLTTPAWRQLDHKPASLASAEVASASRD